MVIMAIGVVLLLLIYRSVCMKLCTLLVFLRYFDMQEFTMIETQRIQYPRTVRAVLMFVARPEE
jgi:hypothetical protein